MRATSGLKAACGILLVGGGVLLGSGSALAIDTALDYQKSPAFVTSPVQPLTMLLLDNTGSMGNKAYTDTYDATKNYYGLFETRMPGSTTADVYYYHPFNISGTAKVCNYTGISGKCVKSDGTTVGECTYPTRTCTTMSGGKYTCYRAAGTLAEFNNSTCDGPDANTDSDCQSGSSCDKHTVVNYTCQADDLTSGKYEMRCSDVTCASGYSCTEAYYCSGNTTVLFGENKCDANNDGTSDCSGGVGNCKALTYQSSGSTRNTKTCYKEGAKSGSYPTADCDSSCGTSRCVADVSTSYYTCNTQASTVGDNYDNATCDGSDTNTTSDCDSANGYACVPAYECTKPHKTTKYFATSNCADYRDINGSSVTCDESNDWVCSATVTSTLEDWTGKTCASCEASPMLGKCDTTGTYTVPNYDCIADGQALCDNYDGWKCDPKGNVSTCEWTDWVQRAICMALGGSCTDDPPVPDQQTSCMTAAEETACTDKYQGVCESGITFTDVRASYWRKTPTTPPGQDCTAGDCLGVGANVTLGNKLNHDQMTQMDVAKKVLIGGKRAAVSSIAGTIELDGDYNSTSSYYTCATGGGNYGSHKYCDNTDTHAIKCLNGSACSQVVTGNNGNIVLQLPADDPNYVVPEGILQKNEGLAWGFGVFNAPDGGIIKNYIGSPNADIVKSINDTPSNGSTPVAESLNTVVNYFRQVVPEYTAGEYSRNLTWDPFIEGDPPSYAPCGRASTIVITDGEPNQDDKFNSTIMNYANNNSSGITDFISPTSGTNNYFVDDVAYWAHTHDLRTEPEMGGIQSLDTYFIYAFGNDAASKLKLQNAAVLGAFGDKNGDGKPNSKAVEHAAQADAREWDFYVNPTTPGDDIPDNYAEANEGDALADKLQNMLGQIQQKVSAGSAASVISASRSGEGAIYQAIFYPKTPPDKDYRKITWVGDVHALWLDDYGNMREDCGPYDTGDDCGVADATLNTKTDKIIEFYSDATTGEAMVRTFRDINGDSHYISGTCSVALAKGLYEAREFDCTSKGGTWNSAGSTDYISTMTLKSFSHYLWSGGRWLAGAAADQKSGYGTTTAERYIFTQKEDAASGTPVPIPFTTGELRTALGAATGYPNYLNAVSATEADKIVNYVRGVDYTDYRSRLYDWGWGDGPQIQKMGDVVGSTPTIVAKPAEDYDLLYADKSYQRFRNKYDGRRIMVYAGGNDGGLHAYNGGYYDRSHKQFLDAPPGKAAYDLGSEMWMFIPKNLLPHLKWLTNPNYNHIYYADMKPYVFDAKIFTPDTTHPDGWGTVLVGGMGFGGGDFTVDTDGNGSKETTLRSSYFILDVTDPENPPVVLGEYTGQDNDGVVDADDTHLGFTLAAPTAIPMLRCERRITGSCPANTDSGTTWPMDWYLAFGSGPHNDSATNPNGISTAIRGVSDQEARIYLLKLGGVGSGALPYVSNGSSVLNVPALVTGFPKTIPASVTTPAGFSNSFFSDLIAVDYDLNFKTDVIYFGSIANTNKAAATYYTGGLHRLTTWPAGTYSESLDPTTWQLNNMFNAARPVSAAATASYDGSRAWVFFGTGRLLDATDDKSDTTSQAYYGLKESYKVISGKDQMDLTQGNLGNLVDVSKVWVEKGTGNLYDIDTNAAATLTTTAGTYSPLAAKTFGALNLEIGAKDGSGIDKYNGWKINFPRAKERNLGQAALLGEILTFTTYMPSSDVCTAEGQSVIWAPYYRTGTAYFKPVLGLATRNGKDEAVRETTPVKGMTLTPSLHSGAESGTKALIQTSTGAIISVDQAAPGTVKSGVISWRDKGAE